MKRDSSLRQTLNTVGHTPTLEVVRLLDEPKDKSGINFIQWQDGVSELLGADSIDFVGLGAISEDIVRHAPLASVRTLIEQPDLARAAELRFMRKILMIGRDGMRVASGGTLPNHYASLPRLTWSMGQLLDGDRSVAMKRNALEACTDLQRPTTLQTLKASRIACERWAETLESIPSLSETLSNPEGIDATTYHTARKKFRLIVHASIVHALSTEDTPSQRLAKSGLVLNEQIGAVKDALLAETTVA